MFTFELRKQLLDCLYFENNRFYILNNPFGIKTNAVKETCEIDFGSISNLYYSIGNKDLQDLVVDYIITKELNFNLMDERLLPFFRTLFHYQRLYIICEVQFEQSYIKNLKYFKKDVKNFLLEHPRVYIVGKLFNDRDYFIFTTDTNEAVSTTVSYVEQLLRSSQCEIINMNIPIVNENQSMNANTL